MNEQKRTNAIVGVVYMLRYHPAVDKIQEVSLSHSDEAFLNQ